MKRPVDGTARLASLVLLQWKIYYYIVFKLNNTYGSQKVWRGTARFIYGVVVGYNIEQFHSNEPTNKTTDTQAQLLPIPQHSSASMDVPVLLQRGLDIHREVEDKLANAEAETASLKAQLSESTHRNSVIRGQVAALTLALIHCPATIKKGTENHCLPAKESGDHDNCTWPREKKGFDCPAGKWASSCICLSVTLRERRASKEPHKEAAKEEAQRDRQQLSNERSEKQKRCLTISTWIHLIVPSNKLFFIVNCCNSFWLFPHWKFVNSFMTFPPWWRSTLEALGRTYGFQKPICHYQLTADLLGRIYHRLFNFLNNFLKRDLGGRGKKFLNFHLDRKIIARWC